MSHFPKLRDTAKKFLYRGLKGLMRNKGLLLAEKLMKTAFGRTADEHLQDEELRITQKIRLDSTNEPAMTRIHKTNERLKSITKEEHHEAVLLWNNSLIKGHRKPNPLKCKCKVTLTDAHWKICDQYEKDLNSRVTPPIDI